MVLHIPQRRQLTYTATCRHKNCGEKKSLPELQEIADTISPVPGSRDAISTMKKNGFICILLSDGFGIVANHIKNKPGFDYCLSNSLKPEKSVATDELKFPEFFIRPENPDAGYDRTAIPGYLTNKLHISQKNIVFVGNTGADIPLLHQSGMGIVPSGAPAYVKLWADKILPEESITPLLDLINSDEKKPVPKNNTFLCLAGAGLPAATAFAGYRLYSSAKRKARDSHS